MNSEYGDGDDYYLIWHNQEPRTKRIKKIKKILNKINGYKVRIQLFQEVIR